MNLGGLALLTGIFTILILIVQRAERKRRLFTAIIMFLVGTLIWNYGRYVLNRDCEVFNTAFKPLCDTLVMDRKYEAAAGQTLVTALLIALVINVLYWALLGRYNPVGSSDSITVIGRDGQVL